MLPAKTSVGPNYDLRSQVAYQIGPHWFAGGFFTANNSRNYNSVSAGFSIHFMFRAQPSTATGPTGLFPTGADSTRPNDALRPFRVPRSPARPSPKHPARRFFFWPDDTKLE